ncbi:hypothetical protein [Deinococcus aquiradiocola]|uniref:Uncharacterized protein n=1 Tax=Deinococcus aquiradiocola TaxID=393059 RepID=A0A917PPN8_9DEIO|nr:hypothetical protein [Deinococcus aquiradiocola]GGJ86988.1 hypothetical protein GCM10008939_33750 [Deinococcus aquiradiocola]
MELTTIQAAERPTAELELIELTPLDVAGDFADFLTGLGTGIAIGMLLCGGA